MKCPRLSRKIPPKGTQKEKEKKVPKERASPSVKPAHRPSPPR